MSFRDCPHELLREQRPRVRAVVTRPAWLALALMLICAGACRPAGAQTAAPPITSFSQAPSWFPNILKPYRPQSAPQTSAANATDLTANIQDGKLTLSMQQLVAAAAANNLSLLSYRYNYWMADVDVMRAKSGTTPIGVPSVVQVPTELGSLAGGVPGTGAPANTARSLTLGPRGAYDPVLAFGFDLDSTESPQNNIRVSGIPLVTTHTSTLGAVYSQAFTTGTSFSLNFNVQRQSTTSLNELFNPGVSSNYTLTVNQQLLSGFGFAANRRFIRVSQFNREAAREAFRLEATTAIDSARNTYWSVVAAKENVLAAQEALTVSKQLLVNNQKELQVGMLAQLDVVTAESAVANGERNLIVAQTAEQQQELILKNLMSRQLNDPLAEAQIVTSDDLPEPKDSDIPSFDDALAEAMRNRPDLLQPQYSLQSQQVAVDYAKKKLKPTLSIFGLVTSSALNSGLLDTWDTVGLIDFPEYAYGFSLSFSLGNRSAQADSEQSRFEEQQMETSLENTRQQIRLDVRNAIIALQQGKAQIAASARATVAEEAALDAEQKKLAAGTSTSYNVILIENDLYAARLAEVQARVDYAQALVEMDRSTGTILEHAGIHVDELLAKPSTP